MYFKENVSLGRAEINLPEEDFDKALDMAWVMGRINAFMVIARDLKRLEGDVIDAEKGKRSVQNIIQKMLFCYPGSYRQLELEAELGRDVDVINL